MYRLILVISLIFFGFVFISSGLAKPKPEDINNGHVWLFENGDARDSAKPNLTGNIIGNPQKVKGINGMALSFNGVSDGIEIPDSAHINIGGPWTNRTVIAVFNCADADKNSKQVIFEEGGRTRGLVIYVFQGEVYVGAWNRSEYNWKGEWISTPISSDRWYEVAAILRNTKGAVEDDKFEMWLDASLVEKRDGGQLHAHGDDNGIGFTNQNVVFHDDDGSGDNRDFFEGIIDEVWVLNEALEQGALDRPGFSVDPSSKLTYAWGSIKTEIY